MPTSPTAVNNPPPTSVNDLLRTISFLRGLPAAEMIEVLGHDAVFRNFQPGETIVHQDDEATHLFYLVSGTAHMLRVRPTAQGHPVAVIDRDLKVETLIGSYALIYNLRHTSSVTAQTSVLTLQFETSALERLLFRFPEIRPQIVRQSVINRLRTMPLMAGMGLVTLSYLAEDVQVKTFTAEQVIYTQDRPAQHLYLINKGQVAIYRPRHSDYRFWLGTGAPFGFPGGMNPQPATTTTYDHWAVATCATEVYVLPWESVRRVALRFPELTNAQSQFEPYETLKQVAVFDQYSDAHKRKLAGFCSFHSIPQHHLIMQQGDLGDSMWILMRGGKAIISALDRGDRALPRTPVDGVVYFHEIALKAAQNVHSTVETEPGSPWLRLHWQDFRRFVEQEGEDLRDKLNIKVPKGETNVRSAPPQDYSWLGRGELLVVLTQRHWIALIQKSQLTLIMLVIGIVAMVLSRSVPGLLVWATSLFLLVFLPVAAWGVLDYLNDFFIVTNQRVIQQEKVILATEYRREALLEQVESIDIFTSFWGNMLGYGTLKVFTAGRSGFIMFDLVPNPDSLRTKIFRERTLRIQRYRAEGKLEIQNASESRLGTTMDLPSRVLPPRVAPVVKRNPRRPWQGWGQLVNVSQPHWESTDRVVWRKHWVVLLQRTALPFSLLISLSVLMVAGGVATVSLPWVSQVRTMILGLEILLAVPFLALLGWALYQTADWWNDRYEITNDRIIDIEKLPLFLSEVRREAQLGQIQDVTYRMSSPVEMILNYGNVFVQTAASQGGFTFAHVPNPRAVKEEINRRLVEWKRQNELQKVRDQTRYLPDRFELYNRLEAGQEPTRLVREEENPNAPSGHHPPTSHS